MRNVQKLTLLPVRRLTDIMTTVPIIKRKKTALYDVRLRQQLHQSRPQKIAWLLYQIISSMKIENLVFFIRSAEQHICPVCEHDLFVVGSRRRFGRKPTGERVTYIIRRLRCLGCERIHHELPDLLIPYKRYESVCFESVLSNELTSDVAADESTLYRWHVWFEKCLPYWANCLSTIAARTGNPVEPSSVPSPSALQRIGHYVGIGVGWLARVVRPIVHSQLWVHTRFAFLSGNP